MALLDTLKTDMKTAMKAREKERLGVIRMLISDLKNMLIDKAELSEADELSFLSTQAKKRRQSIDEYEKANRADLADIERAELAIIQTYLPAPLSEDEVREIIAAAIEATGAASPSDMGKVMGKVMPQVKGRFDGAAVRPLVQAALA